jgi:hypothetical protein
VNRRLVLAVVLGAALGLVYAYNVDPFCIGSDGLSLTCNYKSFFGWQVAELAANVLWTALGAVVGGLGSFAISTDRTGAGGPWRPRRLRRWSP